MGGRLGRGVGGEGGGGSKTEENHRRKSKQADGRNISFIHL